MADKTYKCKKCSAEFTDLKEFRAHNLKCKPVENLVEPVDNSKISNETLKNDEKLKVETEKKSKTAKELKFLREKAQETNTCRGYYEGRKDEICKMYNKCSQCWNDFKG